MRKNLFITLAVLSGMAISMTACLLGDVEALQKKASETNLGVTVNIAEIRGVTVPAPGGIPVKNIIDNDQYAGTVSWSPMPGNSGFNLGSKYTATITITPKKGYTLHLVKANFFTIVGAESVSNATNSGIVTAKFPYTKMVTDIAIKTQPANLIYTHNDTLDLTGLVVMLTYDDGSTEDVTSADFTAKSITATPAQGNSLIHSMHNGQPVKITYGNLTVNTNNLTVNRATPTATDFYVSGIGTFVYNDNSRVVTITPKNGKTTGSITVKYNGITTAPSAVGTYTVTFDVATFGNFNAVNSLSAGTLTIIYTTFNSIDGLNTYLQGNPDNTAITPYTVALNVSDLGGNSYNGSVGYMLAQNPNKYINLDLSGSTFTTIGSSAFSGCTNLTSVTIPDSVTSIDSWAFSGTCTNLTAINVDSGSTTFSSQDGILYNKNKTTLVVYPGGKTGAFIIPNSVTNIRNRAFYWCTNLTGITIPDSVTSIEGEAFCWCTSLTEITIPDSVTTIRQGAFHGTAWLINQPDGLIYAGKVAYTYKGTMPSNTSIILIDGTKGITDGIFNNYTSLTGITIPDSVTSIGDYAFSGCSNLANVTIQNGVTRIGNMAFYGCTRLTSVIIPDSVASIGSFAFGRTSLTNVTIPSSVTSIKGGIFSDCTSLTIVKFEGTISSDNFDYASSDFDNDSGYIGDLRTKYLAGGIGTYTRASGGTEWTKQP